MEYKSTLVRLDTWDLNFLLELIEKHDTENISMDLFEKLNDAMLMAANPEIIDLEEKITELEETIFHLRGTIRRQSASTSE